MRSIQRTLLASTVIPTAVGKTWFPGRDAFRYVGARLDVNF